MDRASYSPKTLGTRLSYPNLVSPADYAREANKFFIQLELERVPEGPGLKKSSHKISSIPGTTQAQVSKKLDEARYSKLDKN